MASIEELERGWIRALGNVDLFYDICDPGCRVWHSTDDSWMSLKAAIDAVHERGGLPEFSRVNVTRTEKGFLCQASATLQPDGPQGPDVSIHLIQLATVENGTIVQAEEYVGPEMDVAV